MKRLAIFGCLVLVGCGGLSPELEPIPLVSRTSAHEADAGVDGGNPEQGLDGSVPPDAGGFDAGGTDAGTPDSGTPDAGSGVELNPGWVGGACQSSAQCNDPNFSLAPTCLTSGFPGGMCTQSCTTSSTGAYVCPDTQYGATTLKTISRCISGNGQPQCASQCDFTLSPTGCRPGYTCVLRQRYGQPDKVFPVCLPSAGQRWPGEPAPANDIGAACSSASSCAHLECLAMNGGYCTKTMCEYAGCPAGSECFGIGSSGQTACLKSCTINSECRTQESYVCHSTYKICYPGTVSVPWDPSVGAPDCASAWGTAGSGLSGCDSTKDDYVVVRKSARNLALCNRGSLVQNFRTGLSYAAVGDKERQGDAKTPEGVFYVAALVPNSQYYKAFLISYPDKADAVRGLQAGLITQSEKTAIDNAQDSCTTPPQSTDLGGYIEIHGMGGDSDWTLGCMAVENSEIDTLWATIGVRDTIVILP